MPILQVCMLRFQNSYIIEGNDSRTETNRFRKKRAIKLEEAEALALSPIPENEKCEFQRSEKEET